MGPNSNQRLTFTVKTDADLTSETQMKVDFGIGSDDKSQNSDLLKMKFSPLFLRILEFAGFEGNLIEFSFDSQSTSNSTTSLNSTMTSFSSFDPSGTNPIPLSLKETDIFYQHNMDVFWYQLYCQDAIFLDRLGFFSNNLLHKLIFDKHINELEDDHSIVLDFVSCNEMQDRSLDPNCLWGIGGICFVCNSISFLYQSECRLCINPDNFDILLNDQFFEICPQNSHHVALMHNTSELLPASKFDSGIFFINSWSDTLLSSFIDLIQNQSLFFFSLLVNNLSENYKDMQFEIFTYKLNFADSSLQTYDFPLNILASLVILYRDNDDNIQIESKSVQISHNKYPFVKFTTCNRVI